MVETDSQLSVEQSRLVAGQVREEIARRRMSRKQLADKAKISISTLEKALGGKRPFTLATIVRLEEALSLSLRKDNGDTAVSANGDVAPDNLGSYSRRAVSWLEGNYLTLRPSFGEKDAIYAYRTEIAWEVENSCLIFRENERFDAAFTQFGEVSIPNQSGHIYLVTNRHGQYRLIIVTRPTIAGEMHGILATLLAGRGSHLTPIAAPIAFVPLRAMPDAVFGRISPKDAKYEVYRKYIQRTIEEPFALFLPGLSTPK